MLRTLLQDRGFVVVTVDWQQMARGGMNAWSAPSCRDVPAAPGAPKLQEANHPTGVPKLAGVPKPAGAPKLVRLALTPGPGSRTAVEFLDRLLDHPSIRVLLVQGSRHPEELQIWLELNVPADLEQMLAAEPGARIVDQPGHRHSGVPGRRGKTTSSTP